MIWLALIYAAPAVATGWHAHVSIRHLPPKHGELAAGLAATFVVVWNGMLWPLFWGEVIWRSWRGRGARQ